METLARPLVANFYNPHEQSKELLIRSFVVRYDLFRELLRAIKSSAMTQPEPHYLIEGQRGSGKTTLLLRLGYAIENDRDLNTWLIPIVFKEEAYYGIRRLYKLWEAIAQNLEAKEQEFSGLFEKMRAASDRYTRYERKCFEILIEALETHSKKLILFVDNLGEMLHNFNIQENRRLHKILTSFPHIRIVGATTVALEALLNEKNPFYKFFQKKRLEGLGKEDTHKLLLELAKVYEQEEQIRKILKEQPGRVESLRILTGGVIRTIILLFEIFTEHEESNTVTDLDIVLDRVTPLYKHRMDDLTPFQREVVNTIALNWDAISHEEITCKTRLKPDKVTKVLKELEHVFIIEKTGAESGPSFYRLQERFFNVWYLMRLSSGGSQSKILWLLRFLESWYNQDNLAWQAQRHTEALTSGSYPPKAVYYLTEAFVKSGRLDRETEHQMILATKKLLQDTDIMLVAELSHSDQEIFDEAEQCYQRGDYKQAATLFLKMKYKDEHIYFRIGEAFSQLKHYQETITYWAQAAERGHVDAIFQLGVLYHDILKNYQNAEKYYIMAMEKGHIDAMVNLGNLYYYVMKNYQSAEKCYLMVVKEGQERSAVLTSKSFSLQALKNYLVTAIKGNVEQPERYELEDFSGTKDHYLDAIRETASEAMFQLGNLYTKELKDTEKADKYYTMAAEAGHTGAMLYLGDYYNYVFKDYGKAAKYYGMAAEQENVEAMVNLGFLYHYELRNPQKAETYYEMAAKQGDLRAINGIAWLYFEQKTKKLEALDYANQLIKKEKNIYTTHTAACIYLWNDLQKEALQLAQKFMYAIEAYQAIEQDILFYLMLLLARKHYQYVAGYFETPVLDLRERFKPLYYALLYFTGNLDYAKLPPELAELVKDIIKKVNRMATDYG